MGGRQKFHELLEVLLGHEVEFLVVGATAAVLEGAPLTTFDRRRKVSAVFQAPRLHAAASSRLACFFGAGPLVTYSSSSSGIFAI